MKPLIIFMNKNEEIHFTKEEFEKLVEEIYNKGYEDGKNNPVVINPNPNPWVSPSITWQDPISTNPYEITCNNQLKIGDDIDESTENYN